MKKLAFLVAFSTLYPAVHAQENSALVQMIAAEKSFAADALSGGVAQAFMKFLDDSAVVFEQGKIMNGKEVWRNRKSDNASLVWYPEFGEVSPAGDLGYTTGPAQFRAVKTTEKPDYSGYFNSIWRKNENGEWKVLLDMGTPAPDAEYDAKKNVFDVSGANSTSQSSTPATSSGSISNEIKNVEEQFISASANQLAYSTYASANARYYRPHAKVSRGAIPSDTATFRFRNAGSGISSSGDLGYAYGYVTSSAAEGHYLRVWKKEQGKWKIVLDAASY